MSSVIFLNTLTNYNLPYENYLSKIQQHWPMLFTECLRPYLFGSGLCDGLIKPLNEDFDPLGIRHQLVVERHLQRVQLVPDVIIKHNNLTDVILIFYATYTVMHLVVLISRPTWRREFMISRIEKNADFFFEISRNVVLANLNWSTVIKNNSVTCV